MGLQLLAMVRVIVRGYIACKREQVRSFIVRKNGTQEPAVAIRIDTVGDAATAKLAFVDEAAARHIWMGRDARTVAPGRLRGRGGRVEGTLPQPLPQHETDPVRAGGEGGGTPPSGPSPSRDGWILSE